MADQDIKTITNSGLLPTPEVSAFKKHLTEKYELLAEIAQDADDLQYNLVLMRKTTNLDAIKALESGFSMKCAEFYSESKELMRKLRPHLSAEDLSGFNDAWIILKDRTDYRLFVQDELDELCDFLLQALKNSNLMELGRKSIVPDIEGEIDISLL